DSESDEAGAGQIARNEQQDEEHDQQFHRDQEHADAHAGLQGNVVTRIGLAGQAGERGARIGKSVHAHAEGGHGETAGNPDHAEEQDDEDLVSLHAFQKTEVEDDDHGNENFQNHQELALRGQVGLAGFVDQLGDF